jgi:hypothetical protein
MIPTGEDKSMIASPDADSLPAHNLSNKVEFQPNKKKANLQVISNQVGEKSEVDRVNEFLTEMRKCKSNIDVDRLVKDNVNFVNKLSGRFRKDVENNVKAWRKTVDG